VLSGRRIARVLGEPGGISAVEVVALDGGAARRIGCDAVCAGHGMVPATEATRLFRAAHHFDAARGGWIPRLDDWGRASVAGLYAAGDCAGIAGAAAAPRTGRIAALGALQDLGLITPADAAEAAADARGRLAASVGVAAAMAAIMAPPRALVAAIPGDCVVCRCEDITRAELEAAADAGARDLNQLKQFTRCGMGPCQGRVCGEAAAELLALRVGDRARVGCFTSRPPLRPVPLRDLLGEFDYADIPIPAPAPL